MEKLDYDKPEEEGNYGFDYSDKSKVSNSTWYKYKLQDWRLIFNPCQNTKLLELPNPSVKFELGSQVATTDGIGILSEISKDGIFTVYFPKKIKLR